jgi:ADP-heptose:LPS heptosyltransferase
VSSLSSITNNAVPTIVIPIVAGIGNALLAVPMVKRLRAAIPGASIFVVARSEAMAEPFRRMTEVAETYVTGKGAANQFRAVRWIRSRSADVLLVPFPSNRWQYSMLALFSGAKRKILHSYPAGYWRSLGFVGTRLPAIKGLHDVEQNLRLLTALGIEPVAPFAPTFELKEEERARAADLMRSFGINASDPIIAIHAGSAGTILSRAKRWPAA